MEKFSRRNWFLLLLFGMIGQIAWSVENMFFGTFVPGIPVLLHDINRL